MRQLFFPLLLVMDLAVSTPAGVLLSDALPPARQCLPSDPPDANCAAAQTTDESEPGDIATPGFTTIIVLTILDLIR